MVEKQQNDKNIEKQIKEIRESLWKIEKQMSLPTDDLYIYKLIKLLEERINVIETILKVDQDSL